VRQKNHSPLRVDDHRMMDVNPFLAIPVQSEAEPIPIGHDCEMLSMRSTAFLELSKYCKSASISS
jgi:hypothetical protein